jgi:hypothetical protein
MASGDPARDGREVSSDPSVAEALPVAYRTLLDAVMRLERLGARREAARYREAAVRIYSGPWHANGLRRLQGLIARLDADCRARERSAGRAA